MISLLLLGVAVFFGYRAYKINQTTGHIRVPSAYLSLGALLASIVAGIL